MFFAGGTNPFLQQPQTPAFGQPSGLGMSFGAQQPLGGGFGAPQASFGAPQATPGGFGAPQANPFGAPASSMSMGMAPMGAAAPLAGTSWVAEGGAERFVVGKGLRGSISSVSWSPANAGGGQAHLACSTWDGDLHAMTVRQQPGVKAVAGAELACPSQKVQAAGMPLCPVLCTAWSRQRQIVCGACDGGLRVWELNANQLRECGKHDQPIRCCSVLEKEDGWDSCAVLSGSWDGCLALWDLRQGVTAALSKWKACNKVYAMDAKCPPYILVGGSDRAIALFDIRNTSQPVPISTPYSPLPCQTRAVGLIGGDAAGQAPSGFVVAGSDGYMGVVYWGRTQPDGTPLQKQLCVCGAPGAPRAVNALCMLPGKQVLSAGGDGRFTMWNVAPDAGMQSFFSDGKPMFVSDAGGQPPPTSALARSKTLEPISCMAVSSQSAAVPQMLAFAHSADGGGGQTDYMAAEASVAHLDNAVRFWVP